MGVTSAPRTSGWWYYVWWYTSQKYEMFVQDYFCRMQNDKIRITGKFSL